MFATSRTRVLTALAAALAVVAATFVVFVASPPSAKAALCSDTTLSYGSRGTCVKLLQKNLGRLDVDGVFGSATRSRVRSFQDDAGLSVNGVVGPRTWRKLRTLGKALAWKSGVTMYMCKESHSYFRKSTWNNSGKRADWQMEMVEGSLYGTPINDDRIAAVDHRTAAGSYQSQRFIVWRGDDAPSFTYNVRSFSRNTLPACA